MNNTKRLFACIMSIVMLISMLSGYSFAFDTNTAKAATSDIDISGTGVGAAPSVQVTELDVMADDVLIVDSGLSVNHDSYSLVWNNSQFDDIPITDKVFKTITAAQTYAVSAGLEYPTVIMAKVDPKTTSIDITMPLCLVSQAYSTMPFVVGSDLLEPWTYNTDDTAAFDDYADLTYALPKINISDDVAGTVGIYGFTLTNGISNTGRTGDIYLELVNTVIDGGSGTILDLECDASKSANWSVLYIENMYVKKVDKAASLLGGFLPAEVYIDGLYVDKSVTPAFEMGTTVNQVGSYTYFSVKNSYFNGFDKLFSFQGDSLNEMKRSHIKKIEITSNTINGVLEDSSVFEFLPSRYTSLKVNKNYIATGTEGTSASLFSGAAAEKGFDDLALDIQIRDNIFNGIEATVSALNTADTYRTCKYDIADNYLNASYKSSLNKVEGTALDAPEHGAVCKSYYADYKMTTKKNGAVAIKSAAATNGDVFVNNSSNTIYYIMKSGDATGLTLTFGDPATEYAWYLDSACTREVADTDVSFEATVSTYYIRSSFTNTEGTFCSEPYSVTVVRESPTIPYFTEDFEDDAGLLSSRALFCDVTCGWVSDGSLCTVEWQGEEYTFIKGVNIFENLEAATAFAKASDMQDPEFVLLDISGGHSVTTRWFPSYPGSYYTVNYATKPYTGDPQTAPDDWKANVGTGEGQFNTEKGITVAGLTLNGNELEGDYKLYGFGLTAGIADGRASSRSNCVNIHLENCYFSLATWGSALFSAADADPASATATEDYLYIKDTYIASNGASHRLFSGWNASHITFDGLFLYAGTYGATNQDYMKQNGANASFRIINSHIKEYSTSLQAQGYRTASYTSGIKTGENKVFEISNSIWDNARISNSAAFAAYTNVWNEIIIKDNIIINDTYDKFQLFTYSLQGENSNNPCTLTVTGNKCYNMIDNFNFGSRALASASVVENNYVTSVLYAGDTTTYGGIKLTANNGTAVRLTGDYWVDSDMTVRPNVLSEDYDFVGINVVADKEAKTIKYIPLAENEIGFVETEDSGDYIYTINFSHIIQNKFGNKMTLAYGKTTADANSDLVVRSSAKLEKLNLTLSVSSPDGTAKPVEYAVTVTNDGPAINKVEVGGTEVAYADGQYEITLSGRGEGETITVTPNNEEAEVIITDEDGQEVTAVSVLNGESKTYTVQVILGDDTVTATLVAARGGAEFDEFDEVLSATNYVNSNDWLKGFNGAFQTLLAKMKKIDRTTATQAEVDAMAENMQTLMDEAVTEAEYRTFIREAKRIKNTDGKYCTVVYEALKTAIAAADAGVLVVSTAADYNALTDAVDTAVANLKGHTFKTYIHDTGSETCVGNGTKTAKCETEGCTETDTVDESDKYANGVHTFKTYVYNEDATHLADGTKTSTCDVCKKAVDTKVAEGTKLTLINSSAVFKDVPADKWFKKFVDYVATYKFMQGTAADTFAPNKTITRAEFVKVLANLAGADTSDNTVATNFTDLKEGAWYVGAVKWAADNGITSGVSETAFAPEAQITREQMCVMLVEYANYAKVRLEKTEDKATFADDAKISSWAKEAVYACQMAGIVDGKGNGFDPRGIATRAEVAVIISIFHENYLLA